VEGRRRWEARKAPAGNTVLQNPGGDFPMRHTEPVTQQLPCPTPSPGAPAFFSGRWLNEERLSQCALFWLPRPEYHGWRRL